MNAASRYSMPSVIGLVIMPSCFVPSILSNSTAKTFDGRGLRTGSAASVMGRPLTMASKRKLRRLRRWLRPWLRRRLQSRLRLWRLRRLWLRRVRPGLVGCLRYRVCRRYRCSLLHILGRLPLLLRPAPHSALSRQRRLHAAVIPHPLNRHYERIDSGPACGARALPHGECDY
jgi:hypothetical protein